MLAAALAIGLAGCESAGPTHSAAVRAAVTPADPVLATPDYWWNRPPAARLSAADFDRLWAACEAEAHARFFLVDRQEYRLGLLTTVPVIAKQIFEPWRTDAVTWHDEAESTLGTIRRTLRFEIGRRPDGWFELAPKVLVERYTSAERRLSIGRYHQAFSGPRAFADTPDLTGDAQTEQVAADYWYPLRRDADLERDLAASISHRLGKS